MRAAHKTQEPQSDGGTSGDSGECAAALHARTAAHARTTDAQTSASGGQPHPRASLSPTTRHTTPTRVCARAVRSRGDLKA